MAEWINNQLEKINWEYIIWRNKFGRSLLSFKLCRLKWTLIVQLFFKIKCTYYLDISISKPSILMKYMNLICLQTNGKSCVLIVLNKPILLVEWIQQQLLLKMKSTFLEVIAAVQDWMIIGFFHYLHSNGRSYNLKMTFFTLSQRLEADTRSANIMENYYFLEEFMILLGNWTIYICMIHSKKIGESSILIVPGVRIERSALIPQQINTEVEKRVTE